MIARTTLILAFPALLGANEALSVCECGKQHLMPAMTGNVPGRKYARDRLADIQHVALDVTPNFAKRTVSGTMSMTLAPIGLPLHKLELDAVDLDVSMVHSEPAVKEWQNTGDKIIFWFPQNIAPGTPIRLDVTFSANPKQGLYFRTPEMGYPATDTQVWSQGEAELHRFWFPCYDYPNEKFTSEVRCTVPNAMSVTSNGRLHEKTPAGEGLTTWHWKQEQPHVNYLIALAAGNFHRLEANTGDVPMALSVPPSLARTAELAFQDTPRIMEFLQKEIGVKYPWAKYDQVYCHDFVAGGMENTSATFLATSELFPPELETLESVESLDAHEMTHQWFGDLVTCRDWSHLWLNEGFASFYPKLYRAEKAGPEAFQEELWLAAKRVIDSNDSRPIVFRDYTDPMQQFDSRAYPKGSWVLNMLRSQLGPVLFRKGIATYLDRHRNANVTSDDLQDVLEEISGRSFDRFFDQWLNHAGFPELAVTQRWDSTRNQLTVTVKQTQKVTETVPLFHFPLPVRCAFTEGTPAANQVIQITKAEESFTFPLVKAPSRIEFDPEFTVLAKWTTDSTLGDKHAALEGPLHGRLRHMASMAQAATVENIALLARVLEKDASVLAQREAIATLHKMNTQESLSAIVPLLTYKEAQVRLAATRALANSINPVAVEAISARIDAEKNPRILGAIIESWNGRPTTPELTQRLVGFVDTTTWQENVAQAAIMALRSRNETSALPNILAKLADPKATFTSRGFSESLDAAAFLARQEKDQSGILQLLTKQLQSPREAYRVAAARALGTLGNPAAINLLKPLTSTARDFRDPVRDAADAAIAGLSSNKNTEPALERIWTELQSLSSKNQKLEEQLKKIQEGGKKQP